MDKEYKEQQLKSSHLSTGTKFGKRVVDSVTKYKKYFIGPVLDVGCNDGLAMEKILKLGHHVTGLEISEEKAALALEKGLDVVVGYQEDMPFKKKQFGTVFSSHTLEHSYDMKRALSEYKRVANRAIIIVPLEKEHKNPAHFSRIGSVDDILSKVNGYEVVLAKELHRLEDELVVILDF